MRTRPVLSVLLTLAALPAGTSEVPGNLARNGGFDEAFTAWTVANGSCAIDAGESRPGSAVCASEADGRGTSAVTLQQCIHGSDGVYVFSTDAQRLSGMNIDCNLVAASHRTTDCSAPTDLVSISFAPDDAQFAHSATQSLHLDATTRAVSLAITCVAASSFVVAIDDVTGLPDQIFKHGFEFVSPVITAGAVLNYTENQAASVIDAALTVSDIDSTTLTGATAQISGNYQSGADSLAFTPVGAITGNFVVASGTLTLTGTDTLANYQTALRSVTYVNNSDNPSTLVRTITWIANDGVAPPSNSATSAVNVAAVNDAPVLANTANLAYTENDAATVLSPALTITDADSTTLTGATVRISSNFDAGKDVLTFTPVGGITGSFVSDTLTLSGSSSLANYQTALRSVKYNNNSDNPSALTRSVTWQVNDGAAANNLSNAPVSTIAVTAVNDAPTGLVPAGSPFAITGNVRRGIASGTLLAGATDPEGSTLTTQLSAVPTNGATVVVNTDGSFTYNPGAGYEGAATFQFVVCDAATLCGTPVTVGVNISGMIWFINAAAGAGTGRLTDPMNSIATFNTSNTGTGNNPAANDNIYLYNGSYTGPLTLLAGQKLLGEGMSVTLAAATGITPPAGSDALPTTTLANRPSWTSSGTTLTLGSGNTLRGFNIGNSTTAKISGTNFGTLTVSEIALSGTGKALNLSTGAFSASATFDSIASTSSGTQGLSMAGITGGSLTIGGTTISGTTTQGILIGTTQANVSFGNTTVSAGSDGVSLQNNSAGTRTFGTLSTTNGSGVGFLHGAGGGLTNVTGATTITNPGNECILIQNAVAANGVTFANVSCTQSGATGVRLSTNAAPITFADLDITPDANIPALLGTDNTGTVTTTSGTFSATTANAVTISGASTASRTPLAMVLDSVTSSGGASNVALANVSGSLSMNAGALSAASAAAFTVTGSTASVIYDGSITNATNGIALTNNGGATITFRGGMSLSTGANAAFAATGGGTVNVCDENPCAPAATGALTNTLTTTTGTALNVANTSIGASHLEFRSISANGAVNGIVLTSTGAGGGLKVKGDNGGANNGSGGTLQATTGSAVLVNGTSGLSLGYMNITNSALDSLKIDNINGLTLNRCNISDNAGVAQDRGVEIGDFVTGTAVNGAIAITNTAITQSPHDNLAVGISGGTSTWTVTGSTFGNNGNAGFNLEIRNTASATLTLSGNNFPGTLNGAEGIHMQPAGPGSTATLTAAITGNTFANNNIAIDVNGDVAATTNYTVSGNTIINDTRRGIGGSGNTSSHAINVFMATTSTAAALMNLRMENNIIGSAALPGSGSSIGNGVRINFNGNGVGRVLLNNNTIREAPIGRGIEVTGRNGTGQLDITLTSNNVNHTDLNFDTANGSNFPLGAIVIISNTVPTAGYTVRDDIRSNTVPAAGGPLPSASEITGTYLSLQELPAAGGSIHQLVDNAPVSANATAELQSHNTGDAGANAGVSLIAGPITIPP